MSFIVAVASESIAPAITWSNFSFGDRIIPADVARTLLPHFRRGANYIRPIYSNGNIVGLCVSSLMTPRQGKRLRTLAEHLLVPAASAIPAAEAPGPSDPEVVTLRLTNHGLWIPRANVDRARAVLAALGDIEIECEEEWGHGVELHIPRGVSLASVLVALEVDVEMVEPGSSSRKREYLDSLRAEVRKLHQTFRSAP